jgi:hypothetical protein
MHIAVTNMTTRPGAAERFVTDCKTEVASLLASPPANLEGKVRITKCMKMFQGNQGRSQEFLREVVSGPKLDQKGACPRVLLLKCVASFLSDGHVWNGIKSS